MNKKLINFIPKWFLMYRNATEKHSSEGKTNFEFLLSSPYMAAEFD